MRVAAISPREETLRKLQGHRLSADTKIANKYRHLDRKWSLPPPNCLTEKVFTT